jgi:tetratricopeptide (TPR) repeat protein
MGCPSSEAIQNLIDGHLSSTAHAELLAHAEHCAICRELVVDLVRNPGLSDTSPVEAAQSPSELRFERGDAIDHFIVIEKVGAGAMGVVFSAYDPPLDRKVAIKVVRPGLGNAAALRARLLSEAQAMAKLSHPNVITVYEVGAIGESVFVAMEFVEGGTLRDWLQAEPRPWRDVVALFVRVGSGLAAAHAAGLVHRDFKPDNVLVGADGRVRVTDFGLVSVSSGEAAARPGGVAPSLTQTGAVLGTPLYMAPEQHRGSRVDARADQFAFCVALFEGLHGVRPFDGELYPELADNVMNGRVREPPGTARVPGWLRRILLRGLLPDPDERYPSMDALLAALTWDPRRTRRRVALAAIAIGLAGWGGFAVWQTRAAERRLCEGAERKLAGVWDAEIEQRIRASFLATGLPYADAAWAGVERQLDDYSRAWVRMHTDACEATRRRGEQSERALDLRMTCLDRRRVELGALTGLLQKADPAVVEKSVSAVLSLTDVSGCADVERLATPLPLPEDVVVRAQVQMVRTELAVADAYRQLGKWGAALALAEPALVAARKTGYKPVEAEALFLTGRFLGLNGESKAAEQRLFDAVVAAAAARDDEVEADARIELVSVAGDDLSRFDDGLRSGELASAILTRLHGDPIREARLLRYEGYVLVDKGAYDEARAHHQRALDIEQKIRPPGHPMIASCLVALGTLDTAVGKEDEALAYFQRALVMSESTLGPEHPHLAIILNDIGTVLSNQGKQDQALVALKRALVINERSLGADNPGVAPALYTIATIYHRRGDLELAVMTYRRALAIMDKANPEHPNTGTMHAGLGESLLIQGKYDEALLENQHALAIREKALGKEHGDVALSHLGIGNVYAAKGSDEQALASYRNGLAIFEKALPESAELAMALDAVGRMLSRKGEHAFAVASFARSRAILDKTVGKDDPTLAILHEHIGEDLARAGKHVQAIEEFQLGLAISERAGSTDVSVAPPLVKIGTSRLALGGAREAIEPLQRAVAIFQAHPGDPRILAEAQFALARALWQVGEDRPRAVALAHAARDGFAGAGAAGQADARASSAWLAEHTE